MFLRVVRPVRWYRALYVQLDYLNVTYIDNAGDFLELVVSLFSECSSTLHQRPVNNYKQEGFTRYISFEAYKRLEGVRL